MMPSMLKADPRRKGWSKMRPLIPASKNSAAVLWLVIGLTVLTTSLTSCNGSEKRNPATAAQRTFSSPPEASTALFEAAKAGDRNALLAIFGSDGKEILFTGDEVEDKNHIQEFVAAYGQMNRWGKVNGGEILYIGSDNYPFPIPLGQNSSGQWYFDTAAGKDEVLARRIGRGELAAIATLSALADAQHQYFSHRRHGNEAKQYAQKFISDEGKQNGLYWPVSAGQTPSPLEPLAEFAKSLGYTKARAKPQPFNGYYFKILDKQGDKADGGAKDYVVSGNMTGGFAILAYPSEYRNSGIMTFVVGADGIVYQKDLGEKTHDAAVAMAEYNPGDGWERVGEKEMSEKVSTGE